MPNLTQKALPDYEVGDYTYGIPKVLKWAVCGVSKLKIGRFCSIAPNVTIFLGGEHRKDWITTYPFPALWEEAKSIKRCAYNKGDVIIGNDVWIGYGAMILSGVKIGDGAVIGAGAVVRDDVEPYSIVIGNPAREKRKRFNDETINKLLAIKWWDWDEEKIKKNLHFLCAKPERE